MRRWEARPMLPGLGVILHQVSIGITCWATFFPTHPLQLFVTSWTFIIMTFFWPPPHPAWTGFMSMYSGWMFDFFFNNSNFRSNLEKMYQTYAQSRIKSGVGSERNACHFLWLTALNPFFCNKKCCILTFRGNLRQNGIILHNCNKNATLNTLSNQKS